MTTLDYFEPSLPDLQDNLPSWWRTNDPTSTVYVLLAAGAAVLDELAAGLERAYLDNFLETADAASLLSEWAHLYGIESEVAPLYNQPDALRGYIEARIAENGSLQSVTNTLMAILNLNSANQGGPVLTFDAGGAGLTFPAGGAGLTMYQYATAPANVIGLVFPLNGSGLTFPDPAMYFPADGSGFTFDSAGAGIAWPAFTPLAFGSAAWLNIVVSSSTFTITVQVKSWLAFDRSAFQRAMTRSLPAHTINVYQEVNS